MSSLLAGSGLTGSGQKASWQAWSTTVSVVVADPAGLAAATKVLEEAIEAWDSACSRFRPDSELSVLNGAEGQPMRVSELLLEQIEIARRAARLTDGLVDPTVGTAMRLLGYDRDFADMPSKREPLTALVGRVPGWQAIGIDHERRRVRLPLGVELDLGATAKAACADRVAERAASIARCGVLADLGGDIAVAGSPPEGGWAVRVADRHDAPTDAPGQTVAVRSGGLATSGTAARRWQAGGRVLHHLVDPATGLPADEHWRTVSVAAGSCVDANIASTAAVILGPAAPDWLEERGLPARLVCPDGAVVYAGAWPRPS